MENFAWRGQKFFRTNENFLFWKVMLSDFAEQSCSTKQSDSAQSAADM